MTGATVWWSAEHRQVAWVWCTAGLGWRATANSHVLRLVLMPGRKRLLLSARLNSGIPRYTRHRGRAVWRCFLADVLNGCFFLICAWQNTPSDYDCGQAKLSQSVNWGAETCAKRKSTSPCLLAIPAFDRIAGLYDRHLNLTGEHANANDFEVRLRALTIFAKDWSLCGVN